MKVIWTTRNKICFDNLNYPISELNTRFMLRSIRLEIGILVYEI